MQRGGVIPGPRERGVLHGDAVRGSSWKAPEKTCQAQAQPWPALEQQALTFCFSLSGSSTPEAGHPCQALSDHISHCF